MSTDYGLFCQECKNAFTADGMGEYAAKMVLDDLSDYVAFARIRSKVDIDPQAYWCSDIEGLLEWLNNHGDHPIVLTDEYGYLFNENGERVQKWE